MGRVSRDSMRVNEGRQVGSVSVPWLAINLQIAFPGTLVLEMRYGLKPTIDSDGQWGFSLELLP